MKPWQRMIIAWLLFLFYLLAGAFIFQAIELPHEIQVAERFFQSLEEFLDNHPCVPREELYKYSEEVVEAVDRGVFYLHAERNREDDGRDGVVRYVGERRTVWDLPNSFFFSATIVTTIGYGDLTPKSSLGRIICMIYATIGLPLTGWVIGVIAQSLTAYWVKALDQTNRLLLICVRFARFRKAIMILVTILVLYAILLQVPATVLGYIEQWDTLTAVYYCFITLTTIGFGDLVVGNHPDFSHPAKWTLKTCMVLYVMLGLSLLVALSSAIVKRANKTVRKSVRSGNTYQVSSRSQKQKTRKRVNEALENEVALTYIPDLSFARKTPSNFLTKDELPKDTDVESIELRSLSNRTDDVPPCYEEVVDLSESTDTICSDQQRNSPSSLAELSVHCASLDNGHLIERSGVTYLDHAGATIYARSQLALVHQDLMSNIYGNPHSQCTSSRLSTDTIEQVRYRILQHFNTSPEFHSVIFTAGCTAALKLLADNFDWASKNRQSHQNETTEETEDRLNLRNQKLQPGLEAVRRDSASPNESKSTLPKDLTHHAIRQDSQHAKQEDHSQHAMQEGTGLFCYLLDNHTSVVGMREIAKAKGADVLCITYEDIRNGTNSLLINNVKKDLSDLYNDQESDCPVNGAGRNCLLAYPAQSNFSGAKYPLNLVSCVKSSSSHSSQPDHWAVVLDAASLVSTSPLDLSECRADFVAVSFYKIFGFPTGLGALVVRNEAAKFLQKTYFGGGTVQAYLARRQFSIPKSSLSDQFEDGTLPFLDIIALKHGFDAVERLAGNVTAISDHTFSLAKYVHHMLASYRHANGRPVAELYCDNDFQSKALQGPIVNFLLRRSTGEFVGYAQIERLAALHSIHLRTGCFCNTGACQRHLGLKDEQILNNFQAGHVCGDEMDLISGQPTGSVRISFGYMSTLADADGFLSFIEECFIEKTNRDGSTFEHTNLPRSEMSRLLPRKKANHATDSPPASVSLDTKLSCSQDTESQQRGQENYRPDARPTISVPKAKKIPSPGSKVLTNIFLYPVKSCSAFEVSEWEMGTKGLLYDRHWMVVTDSGVCLSQKREERLCLIKPTIDLKNSCMWLQCQGQPAIRVPLDAISEKSQDQASKNYVLSKVCFDRVKTLDCGDTVAKWLFAALGRQCRLLQEKPEFNRNCRLAEGSSQQSLSLVNESPFTLLCRPSALSLLKAIGERNGTTAMQPIGGQNNGDQSQPITAQFPPSGEEGEESDAQIDELIGRFRGNLVIDGWQAFDEDEWKKIQIGHHVFTVAGACIRCQMVCVDQNTAKRNKEPLLTLSMFRGKKVPFGIHLLRDETSSEGTTLRVGDHLSILQRQ